MESASVRACPLSGGGLKASQVFGWLENALADAEIEVLMAAALKLAKLRLDASAKSSVIIKADAQKQRARRAKKTALPASTRRTAKAKR